MGNPEARCKMKPETKQAIFEMAVGLFGGLFLSYLIIYAIINGLVR
jgi:hypothetical protein